MATEKGTRRIGTEAMEGEEVLLTTSAEGLVVKARGHVTARLCRELRHRVEERFAALSGPLVVDLSDCSYMDSTFLGLLASLNRRLCGPRGSRLIVHNPSDRCELLMREVGLLGLLSLRRGPEIAADEEERVTCREQVNAEFLLKAHEELMELSDENRRRFSLIRGILKREAG